jgi:hypothetical protein
MKEQKKEEATNEENQYVRDHGSGLFLPCSFTGAREGSEGESTLHSTSRGVKGQGDSG